MRILITGNTGFKGTWLTFMLKHLEHEVHGLALTPEKHSLFAAANMEDLLSSQDYVDIRDYARIEESYFRIKPELIFHLAAQPLVRDSYIDPRYTIETNALGTFNVLEATRKIDSIKGVVVITTDKVYRNLEQINGYKEDDALGGHDPYSASKAMADIVSHSWSVSFAKFPVAIARAGNVVGGGDFSKDRLIPDIFKAVSNQSKLAIRYPKSIRPWQHVLDCLNGYVSLGTRLNFSHNGEAWNFGPEKDSHRTVQDIVNYASSYFQNRFIWNLDVRNNPHEAGLLALDSSKAENELNWRNKLNFDQTLKWTFHWYDSFLSGKSARDLTFEQIDKFYNID